jgi:hypothetical protein
MPLKTRMDRQIDRETDRLKKPFKIYRFPQILLRTNYREQTSRLKIRNQNSIFRCLYQTDPD